MPPPPGMDENSSLKTDSKPMYGLETDSIGRKGDDFS